MTEAEPRSGTSAARASRHLPFWLELVLLLVLALALAVGIKALLVQAFYIPSGSMNNTLVFNDRILVEKVSYWGSASPQRGDVVVFSDPGGWLDESESPHAQNLVARALELVGLFPTGGHLVKRVIGIGGDTVACCDQHGRVTVNGTPLHEQSYLAPGQRPSLITFREKVPPGYLWVMGDNRSESADSRVHLGDPGGGFVPVDDVVGKVFSVIWPLKHFTFVSRPATFQAVEG
ncbi:MAG: signal peptidase [Nocardioidaceae bacterium]|nr:signal peptidase [Nocardioidaceae bacterium]